MIPLLTQLTQPTVQGSKTVPGVLQKPLEEVSWPAASGVRSTFEGAPVAEGHSHQPCLQDVRWHASPLLHSVHHTLQVSTEYDRVCAGCVNADTSAKTFVRTVRHGCTA